ncbi:hypothetical protein ACNKHL_25130 [Shigella flexneri]
MKRNLIKGVKCSLICCFDVISLVLPAYAGPLARLIKPTYRKAMFSPMMAQSLRQRDLQPT